jgi:hypothetical protein
MTFNDLNKNHLSIKAKLANEIVAGKYPELAKDLIYIKACQEGEGLNILPHDKSLNKHISKIEALKVLKNMCRDDWEFFIAFDIITSTYDEVLT